jgi:PAS domain S-box-containing protein
MTDDAITILSHYDPPPGTGNLIQEGPFRNAFEQATIGMVLADRQGRYLAANRAFCEMVGYSEHELAQLDFSAITHPGDLPENLRLGQQLLRGEIQSFKYEKRYLHKSGRIIWCLLSASVALDADGQPLSIISQIQDITDRKQAEATAQDQRALAEVLRDTAEALNTTLHYDELLDRILVNARRVVPHDLGKILLVDANGVAHIVRIHGDVDYSLEDLLRSVNFPVATTTNLRRMVDTGRPLVIDDVHDWPGWVIVPGMEWVHAHVGAPIYIRGELIGFIHLDHHASKFFTPEHADRLQSFAHQVALAIENVRLIQAEREQSDLAEALRDVAAALNSTLDINEVLDRVLANAGRVVPHDAINIMLLDPQRTVARVVGQLGYRERGVEDWIRTTELPISRVPGFRHMIETARPHVVLDTRTDAEWVSFAESQWVRSYIGMPIQIDGQVVGFLNLDSATPHFYTPDHAHRLQAFADQAAIAIRNARLYEASRRNVQRLTLMHEAIVTLAHRDSLREVYQIILRSAVQLTDLSFSALALFDGQKYLSVVAVHNLPETLIGQNFPALEGLAGQAIKQHATRHVADYNQFEERMPIADRIPLSSVMALPLIWQDQIIGMLGVGSDHPQEFSEEDVRTLTMFATLAAAALAQGRALNEAQAREVEARTLSVRLANAQEEERSRIANLLHDAVGHHLVMIQKNTELIQSALAASVPATAYLTTNLDLLQQTHELVRSLAMDLDSKVLADLGLAPAVRQHIERLCKTTGLPIRLHITGGVRRLWASIERVAFRGLQEALTNALRHAQATEISAQLHFGTQALRLTVQDNGRGFDPVNQPHGTELGLPQLRRQVEALRGEFILESSAGDGTMIALTLPIRATAPLNQARAQVLIVDDHEMMRQGLRQMLAATHEFACVGEAASSAEALQQTEATQPDLILMDIMLSDGSGIEATRQIAKRFPRARVIMLTYHDDESYLDQALQAGAKGYLLKSDHSRLILSALRAVLDGETFISPALVDKWTQLQSRPAAIKPIDLLTARERQVLQLVATGHSNQAIADQLGISIRTVEVHRHNILDKLELKNTAQLVQFALHHDVT